MWELEGVPDARGPFEVLLLSISYMLALSIKIFFISFSLFIIHARKYSYQLILNKSYDIFN